MKKSISFFIACITAILTIIPNLQGQSGQIVSYSPAIEPGLGYVFKTQSGFGAARIRLDLGNVLVNNRLGFYYTFEQNSNTADGKYVRDLAGVSYSLNKSFAIHAGAGLWAKGIITDGIRWGGLRKEMGVTYRIPQFPMSISLGYSTWARATATFGYSIPVNIKRVAPRTNQRGSRDTMYIIDTTARVQQKLDADIKALEESSKLYFDYKSDSINNTEKIKLDELVKYLRENPKYKLEIYGNTDQVGSVEYNQALSQQRATNTRNYLISRGIASNRMKVLPMGKTKATGNETEIEKDKLRSVEFEIIRK